MSGLFDGGLFWHGPTGAGPGTGGIPTWQSGECYKAGDEVIYNGVIFTLLNDICPSTVNPLNDTTNFSVIGFICFPVTYTELSNLKATSTIVACADYFITDRNILIRSAGINQLSLSAMLLDGTEVDEIQYDFDNDYIQLREDSRGNSVGSSYQWFVENGVNPVIQFEWQNDDVRGNAVRNSSLPLKAAIETGALAGFKDNTFINEFITIDDLDTTGSIEKLFAMGGTMVWNMTGSSSILNTTAINSVFNQNSPCNNTTVSFGTWEQQDINFDAVNNSLFTKFQGENSSLTLTTFNNVTMTACTGHNDGNYNLTGYSDVDITNVRVSDNSLWTGSNHDESVVMLNWTIKKTSLTTNGNTAACNIIEGVDLENCFGEFEANRALDITGLQLTGLLFKVGASDAINLLEASRFGSNQLKRVDVNSRLTGTTFTTNQEDFIFGGYILEGASATPGATVIDEIVFNGVIMDISVPLEFRVDQSAGPQQSVTFNNSPAASAASEHLIMPAPFVCKSHTTTDRSDFIIFKRNRTNANFVWQQKDAQNFG